MRDFSSTGRHLAGRNDGTVTGDEHEQSNGVTTVQTIGEDDKPLTADQIEQKAREVTRDAIMVEARQLINSSRDYWQAAYAEDWAKSQAHFQSKHAPGSKYHQKGYARRSKVFRPKTRATVRRLEAACSTAFFGTNDPLAITPTNEADDAQVVSAAIWEDVLRHRLTKTMPWYQTVVGAFQDTQVMKACFSHNYWAYEEDEHGNVIRDEPACDLIPAENLRFHEDADWRDPINTSPFIIHVMPMTADEVQLRMESEEWMQHPLSTILAATKEPEYIEQSRDKDKGISNGSSPIQDYQTVWVVKIIQRKRGTDLIYYTLGDVALLTEPKPLNDVVGFRNYTMGVSNIEAHKVMPDAPVELYSNIQELTNDIANLRVDNVRLASTGRFLARRSANIDTRALTQSIAGAVVMTDNPESDIHHLTAPDVTRSNFQEQDYINADFDDIAGNNSSSSVNTNRRMGETASGMELLANDSNQMTEYQIKIFAVTWVQKTLEQLLWLCQKYETDTVIMSQAANRNIDLLMKHGVDTITDELLDQKLTCTVSIGNDATNPMRKVETLRLGVQTQAELGVPIKAEAVVKQVWGALGRGDGEQFIETEPQEGPSPEQIQMELEMQKMQVDMQAKQMDMQAKQIDAEAKMQVAQLQFQREQILLQREHIQSEDIKTQADAKLRELETKQQEIEQRIETERQKAHTEREKLAVERMKIEEEIAAKIGIASMQNQTQRDIAALNAIENDAARDERTYLEKFRSDNAIRESDASRKEQARQFDSKLKADADQKNKDRSAAHEDRADQKRD